MAAYQQGGFYNGRQYWDNTFGEPGKFNPLNNQSGQKGSAPVQNAADAAYLRSNPSAPSASIPQQYTNPPSQTTNIPTGRGNLNLTGSGNLNMTGNNWLNNPKQVPGLSISGQPNANNPYTVKLGDTLSGIYGNDWANKSGYKGDPTKLQVGSQLPDPNGSSSPTDFNMSTSGNLGVGTNNPTVSTATTEALRAGADPSMLNRAKQYLGSTEFVRLCQRFTEKFTKGTTGSFPSAIAAWRGQQNKASTDLANIKPGDSVYFAADNSNQGYGHTGVYMGNGQFLNPSESGVQLSNLDDWMSRTGQRLLGYVSDNTQKSTSGSQSGFQFPSLVEKTYAEGPTPTPGFNTNIGNVSFGGPLDVPRNNVQPNQPQQNQQQPASNSSDGIPMDSGGRTQIVKDTPNWIVPIMQKYAQAKGVPMAIVTALAKHESWGTFDPTIRQRGFGLGRGMFQIDIGQNKDVTEDEAFDPEFSTKWAVDRLKEGYDRTGSWVGALRYYNGYAGYNSNRPGYNGRPVSELTQEYANKVMALINEGTVPVEDPAYKKKMLSLGR